MALSGEKPIVRVRGLSKRFGAVTAVDNLSFDIPPGEIVGLLGPNGAGKTTTINLLMGLITPSAGAVEIFGRRYGRDRWSILSRLNFSSAYVGLPNNLTVWENLHVFARLYAVHRPRRRVQELIERFGIQDLARKLTGSLSSGQQTRLNLIKSLINDPDLLLLDEPTASLDPEMADRARAELKGLAQERAITMIYTSHNMLEIERMCGRVIFLARGRIVADGPPSEVLARARSETLESLFIRIARSGDLHPAGGEEDAP
jgi:ABC-2 type transport system ATP-binding protein